jgi:cellobiose phosphorylase
MYRLIVESLLGLTREKDRLRFTPCLPADWAAFRIRYRYGGTVYEIAFRQVRAGADQGIEATSVTLDGVAQHDCSVHLVDDRATHRVSVEVHAAGR